MFDNEVDNAFKNGYNNGDAFWWLMMEKIDGSLMVNDEFKWMVFIDGYNDELKTN